MSKILSPPPRRIGDLGRKARHIDLTTCPLSILYATCPAQLLRRSLTVYPAKPTFLLSSGLDIREVFCCRCRHHLLTHHRHRWTLSRVLIDITRMGPTKPQSQVKRSPTAPTDEKSTSTGTSTDSSIPLAAGANGNNINNTGLSFTTKMLLLAGVLSLQFCWLTLGQSSSSAATDKAGSELDSRGCPSYTEYSQVPHGDRSSGPLALPFMRPEERCRTFNSSAVEVSPAHTPSMCSCGCSCRSGSRSAARVEERSEREG